MLSYYAIASIAFIVRVSSRLATICDEEPLYTFIPDVYDCNAWFFCGINGPVRGVCPNQYLFNPKTRLCDWPQNVDCFQCPTKIAMLQIPIEGSCRMFIRCINGMASQSICQDGLQFNKVTGQCDLESVVQCESGFRCPDKVPNSGSVAIRDNRNCSVYYLCIGDTAPIRQECNPELHFDPITYLCTYPHNTDCPINQNHEGPGDGPGNNSEPTELALPVDPTDTTLAPTQVASFTDLSDSSTESITESKTSAPEEPFECPFDGIFAHQTECSEFYICINNVPHHMLCTKGLYFNVATLQCDIPENANCDFYNSIYQSFHVN